MKLDKKIEKLQKSHDDIEKKVTKLETTGSYESAHLEKMKKQRLHFSEQIAKLKAEQEFQQQKATK